MYKQNGTITYRLLEYNNFKVEEHNNPIEIISKVFLIYSTKHKEESMTLSTDYLKPLNQWSKWERMKKSRDILMELCDIIKLKCLH